MIGIINRSVFFLVLLTFSLSSHAAGDFTAQTAITVNVELGNADNALRFYPARLEFETGKLYKLVIRNASQQKHYFSAEGLARSVFTRKVQVMGKSNRVLSEVKGVISEIEVYPGNTTQWWFVPVKTLHASGLHCSIKGHTEAGMTGHINIK